MAHKKFIDSVMKHGQVTIKDLDEFLRFTLCDYDMRTIDDNYISILLPRQFDINKVFGLDVCDDDYVVLYLCWYPDKDVFGRQFEMRLYHYDNSNDIVMTQSQYDAVLQRFKKHQSLNSNDTVGQHLPDILTVLPLKIQHCFGADL